MSYLTYFTLITFVCLAWIVGAFYVGNLFEKHLRKQHRRRQLKSAREEMQRQYQSYMRALNHNKQLIKELNK